MAEGWKVRLVHGRWMEDTETLSTLVAAMDWSGRKGAEYHPLGADCLGMMQDTFVLEMPDAEWFQYGTNYHWVTFERVV